MNNSPEGIATLAALMHALGYKALVEESTIETGMGGMIVLIHVWPQSLQIYFGITLDEDNSFDLEKVNLFNQENRFVKCYTRSGAASFETDLYFIVENEHAKDYLRQIFRDWEFTINKALKALHDAQNSAIGSPTN